jgi:predicted lipoprotein with Yx(FWY)xxD motif
MNSTSLRQRAARPNRRGKTVSLTMMAATAGALLFVIGPVAASTSHSTMSVRVSTASTKKLGAYLISGRSLYQLNKKDCTSAKCLKAWPPLLLPKGVTHAAAGRGVNAVKLGTVRTANGALQVTYGGKALFRFFGDTAPGQVNGNNLVTPFGTWTLYTTRKPTSSGGTTTTTSPSSGGGTTSTTIPGTGGGMTTTTIPSGGGTAF